VLGCAFLSLRDRSRSLIFEVKNRTESSNLARVAVRPCGPWPQSSIQGSDDCPPANQSTHDYYPLLLPAKLSKIPIKSDL
jgi:hypothetical protein